MGKLRDHPVIKQLLSVGMPAKDFAVFCSGPMFAHGFYDLPHDVDVLARGQAWEKAREHHRLSLSVMGDEEVKLFGGKVEIFRELPFEGFDVDKLIDEADVIEGIRWVKLDELIRIKEKMGREKDKEHVRMIREYLEKYV